MPLAPKRPEDNYEISDAEEDEEGNRLEPDRTGKHVPAWCANYKEMVSAQAAIDPDSIFGGVPRCDLEAIFPDSLFHGRNPVKRRRGSSCRWFSDRLTEREVAAYASSMGQRKAVISTSAAGA